MVALDVTGRVDECLPRAENSANLSTALISYQLNPRHRLYEEPFLLYKSGSRTL
jgi:hypothetical protein